MKRLWWLLAALLVAAFFVLPLDGGAQNQDTKKIDLKKPFDHKTHLKELRKQGDRVLTCADCHALTSTSGQSSFPICSKVRMPFPTHDKCTGCHPTAFFTKPLVICTNCHVSVSFSEKTAMKEQTGDQAPLKADFSHKLHLDPKERVKAKFKFNKDCTFCHPFSKADAKTPSLPAHAQCCECHTKAEVEPNINNCAGCHNRPESEKNPVSMVRKFSHADHRTDPVSGSSLDCLKCHYSVPKATKISTLKLPPMASCVDCHKGEVAFDYTQCLRCHGPEIHKLAVPEDHKKKPEDLK